MSQHYSGFVPPCGIFCGGCPNYRRANNGCEGAEVHCRKRRCKGIYVCCVERRGLRFCHECPTFPCARYRKFAATWLKHGQCLEANQARLLALGAPRWLAEWNAKVTAAASP
jgi:hypothetical protein